MEMTEYARYLAFLAIGISAYWTVYIHRTGTNKRAVWAQTVLNVALWYGCVGWTNPPEYIPGWYYIFLPLNTLYNFQWLILCFLSAYIFGRPETLNNFKWLFVGCSIFIFISALRIAAVEYGFMPERFRSINISFFFPILLLINLAVPILYLRRLYREIDDELLLEKYRFAHIYIRFILFYIIIFYSAVGLYLIAVYYPPGSGWNEALATSVTPLFSMFSSLITLAFPIVMGPGSKGSVFSDWHDTGLQDPTIAATPQEKHWKQSLTLKLEEERVYRDPGLNVASLAHQTNIPEYRLRQLINGNLGYRNFNTFLNDYRIREAKEILANPERAHETFSTIAPGLGFGSIASFNRIFRDTVGMTPTEYRTAALGNTSVEV